jgi:hypothetical protein
MSELDYGPTQAAFAPKQESELNSYPPVAVCTPASVARRRAISAVTTVNPDGT